MDGGSKNQNSRNPRNPPKFTKSSDVTISKFRFSIDFDSIFSQK